MSDIFPFTIGMPAELREVFLSHNVGSWFEVDVTIRSMTEVTFHVYGMFSSMWGDRGDHLRDIEANVTYGVLWEHVKDRAERVAEIQLDAAENRKRQVEIDRRAAALLSAIGRAA